MPTFKKNPSGMKPSGFKMKYKNSAFPFKGSPVKALQTESGESVIEVDDEGEKVEEENINVAKKRVLSTNSQGFINRGIAGAY